jgi:hypothetical protein
MGENLCFREQQNSANLLPTPQMEAAKSTALEAVRVSPVTLPIIDVGGLLSDKLADRQAVGAKLREACADKGFFYISNHGVPDASSRRFLPKQSAFLRFPLPIRPRSTRRIPGQTGATNQ